MQPSSFLTILNQQTCSLHLIILLNYSDDLQSPRIAYGKIETL